MMYEYDPSNPIIIIISLLSLCNLNPPLNSSAPPPLLMICRVLFLVVTLSPIYFAVLISHLKWCPTASALLPISHLSNSRETFLFPCCMSFFYLCSYPWQWQQNAVPHGCCSISHGGLTKGFLQSLLAFCPPPNSNKRQKNKETHSPTSHLSSLEVGILPTELCWFLFVKSSWYISIYHTVNGFSRQALSGLVFTECFDQHRWLVRSPFEKIQFLSFFMVSFYNKLVMQLQWRLVRGY